MGQGPEVARVEAVVPVPDGDESWGGSEGPDRRDDAALYREVAPELIRFATALVGRTDAPDVLSGAVVKALATPAWPEVRNRKAYLYRSVFNESQTWLRRAGRRPLLESLAHARAHARDEERFELPNLRPDVRVAVTGLSLRQRAVIVLTYWADLDPRTVADRLGISEGAVRRHLARARAHLREVLDA
jgi:RNA polymerase sigma-70 factor (ECF subfamily)